jgi:hypothetical protein
MTGRRGRYLAVVVGINYTSAWRGMLRKRDKRTKGVGDKEEREVRMQDTERGTRGLKQQLVASEVKNNSSRCRNERRKKQKKRRDKEKRGMRGTVWDTTR